MSAFTSPVLESVPVDAARLVQDLLNQFAHSKDFLSTLR